MMNGSYIVMRKSEIKRVFFMFDNDGSVREITHGLGKLMTFDQFIKLFKCLEKNGYYE